MLHRHHAPSSSCSAIVIMLHRHHAPSSSCSAIVIMLHRHHAIMHPSSCSIVIDHAPSSSCSIVIMLHCHHVRLAFFHLCHLRLIRRSLPQDAMHSLVRALVHSRLDYCNSILANAPSGLLGQLQSVLRAAARLVLRLPARSKVSDLMHEKLHWLDINKRVTFKLCVIRYSVNTISLLVICLRCAFHPVRFLAEHPFDHRLFPLFWSRGYPQNTSACVVSSTHVHPFGTIFRLT